MCGLIDLVGEKARKAPYRVNRTSNGRRALKGTLYFEHKCQVMMIFIESYFPPLVLIKILDVL